MCVKDISFSTGVELCWALSYLLLGLISWNQEIMCEQPSLALPVASYCSSACIKTENQSCLYSAANKLLATCLFPHHPFSDVLKYFHHWYTFLCTAISAFAFVWNCTIFSCSYVALNLIIWSSLLQFEISNPLKKAHVDMCLTWSLRSPPLWTQFQWWSDWQWPFLVLSTYSRKIIDNVLFLLLSPSGNQ